MSGLVKVRDIKGIKENIVVIIGDGFLSGGEVFEGLDNVVEFKFNFIIIVNDNEMFIVENYGGIYGNFVFFRKINGIVEMNIFKVLGFKYVYIEEGNNVNVLIEELKKIKDIDEFIVVYIYILKGNGYFYVLIYKENFYWILLFDIEIGKFIGGNFKEIYKKIVINYIIKKIDNDNRIVVINVVVLGVLDLCEFRESYFEKYFDVGIVEEYVIVFFFGLVF